MDTDDTLAARARELRAKGLSLKAIARETGMTEYAVRRATGSSLGRGASGAAAAPEEEGGGWEVLVGLGLTVAGIVLAILLNRGRQTGPSAP